MYVLVLLKQHCSINELLVLTHWRSEKAQSLFYSLILSLNMTKNSAFVPLGMGRVTYAY